jgi:tocopherol O-methyltransferase
MIVCDMVSKRSIRNHYDLATPFYRFLWGRHIHHGLWKAGESPKQAQQCLIERLAEAAHVTSGAAVLDVGCGMGGSTIELARRYRCTVTGVTISPVQYLWASFAAAYQGMQGRTRFRCADVEKIRLPDTAFDVVWNVECSEHLFDKPAFVRRVAGWLKPGGRLALCAWLAGDSADAETQARAVCKGFLCPSLGTAGDYRSWFRAAGLVERTFADLTTQVSRTWDVCLQSVQTSGMAHLGGLFGADMRRFLDSFTTLRDAYRSGAMGYGLFVTEKPAGS